MLFVLSTYEKVKITGSDQFYYFYKEYETHPLDTLEVIPGAQEEQAFPTSRLHSNQSNNEFSNIMQESSLFKDSKKILTKF